MTHIKKKSNEWQLHRKLEEEQNPDRQGCAQTLKYIIIDLNEEEWQPTQGEEGILRALATAEFIIGLHPHLLYYLLNLANLNYSLQSS